MIPDGIAFYPAPPSDLYTAHETSYGVFSGFVLVLISGGSF